MNKDEFFAFVLMPFDAAFDDVYKLGIKETAQTLGILAERVDEQIYREGILERIYRQIDIADIIIADMTGKNPNVFYEVGYAHAKGKLCILLTAEASDIPFDLKHRRHIVYGRSIRTLRDGLRQELEWAQGHVRDARKNRINVTVKIASGAMTKTTTSVTGEVDFTIDMTNETELPSADIDAIYFYSTKRWTVRQDDKTCGSTQSDVPMFDKRHFLTPPVRRLGKGSWCQIKFSARRVLAWLFKGEEFKNEYRVTGRGLLRIVTQDGHFDQDINVDVLIEEFPF